MLDKARDIIRKVLGRAECPAVLSSFGKDSMLLLHLVREIKPDVSVIWFRPQNEVFARRMILELDLDVWSWMPSDVYVLPNREGLTLVREQAFGHHRFPVLLDIEQGEKCIADVFTERTPELFPHFDAYFIGWKDSDSHSTLGTDPFPPDGRELGRGKLYGPLRHMTDEDVWKAIHELGVPYDEKRYSGGADPDTLQACTRCLSAGTPEVFCPKEQRVIPTIDWQPQERLSEFRQRFGFKEAA